MFPSPRLQRAAGFASWLCPPSLCNQPGMAHGHLHRPAIPGSHHQGALEMEQEESPDVPLRGEEGGPSTPGGATKKGASDFGIIHCVGDTSVGPLTHRVWRRPRIPAEALMAPPGPSPHAPLHSPGPFEPEWTPGLRPQPSVTSPMPPLRLYMVRSSWAITGRQIGSPL